MTGPQTRTKYTYDAEGRRAEKATATETTVYLHDLAGNPVVEWFNTTGWSAGYVYLGGQLVAEYSLSTTHFVHSDHLGSTRLVTDLYQNVAQNLDYLPYGELISTDTGITTHKFTGKERDTESGLDDFGARYFGSTLGRFMSPDGPFSDQNTENPQSWNLYTYARNNPIRFTDTDGRACVQQDDGRFKTVGTEGQSCEDAAKEDENVNPSVIVTPSHDDQIKMFAEDIGNIGIAELKRDVLIMAVGAAGVAADAGTGILGARGAVARGGIAPVLKGAAGAARAEAEVAAEGGQVLGEEVTIQNSAGRARADFVCRDANGNLVVGEAKNGPTAALNPNQKAVYGEFEKSGGQFVGQNAQKLPPSVGPTQVRIFKY